MSRAKRRLEPGEVRRRRSRPLYLVEAAGVEPASESSEAWLLHAYLSFFISPVSFPESGERTRASLLVFVCCGQAVRGTLAQLNDTWSDGLSGRTGRRSRVF